MNVSHEYAQYLSGTEMDLAFRIKQMLIEVLKLVVEATTGRKMGRKKNTHTSLGRITVNTLHSAYMKWSNKNYVMLAAIWSYVIWS